MTTKERDYEAEMKLPDGWTCDDCRFFRYCCRLIGNVAGNTSCDWAPSRFQINPAVAVRKP